MQTHAPLRTTAAFVTLACSLAAFAGSAAAQPDEVLLAGSVRDFRSTHPDFGLSGGGAGVVTGLVSYSETFGRPVHRNELGLELSQQALDGASREIAPHLYVAKPEDTAIFQVPGGMDVVNRAVVDLWDPAQGPYDPATATPFPELDDVEPLDPITPPTMGTAKTSTIRIGNTVSGGISTLTGELWCDKFWVGNSHVLTIEGDTVIRADASFEIRNQSTVLLAPGATLTIWAGGTVAVDNNTQVGMNADDHTSLTIYNFGTDPVELNNSSEVTGVIVSPLAPVIASNSSEFFGGVQASDLQLDNTSGVHIAGNFVFLDECFAAGDTQAAAGLADDGLINSPASHAQWFRDVPGVNQADAYQMVMKKQGGEFVFSETDWSPIDDALYGNEGGAANRGYTIELGGVFLNQNCGDMFIEVETGMDCWVYINDVLAIDLGGISGNETQRIELDRLGLKSDDWNTVRVYIAQRLNSPQDFTLRTSLPLTPPRQVNLRSSDLYD